MQVDGVDQAEPRTPFSWNKLPVTTVERWIAGREFDIFHASHNGYERLEKPVTHERWIINFKAGLWLVRDVAAGRGEHELEVAWHLPPISHDGAPELAINAHQAGWAENTADEWWSPAYGTKASTNTVRRRFRGPLPAELGTFLSTMAGDSIASEHMPHDDLVVYRCDLKSAKYVACFAKTGKSWQAQDWSSDADLVCAVSRDRRLEAVVFCNGSRLEWQGRPLLSATKRISWCEVVRCGQRFEVFSPEKEAVRLEATLDPAEPATMAQSGRTFS
jgi:hypothetical protein